MNLTSISFTQGNEIPREFTCEGHDRSPMLSWMDPPRQTESFALIVHDADAPGPNGYAHWIVYDIPSTARTIEEDAPKGERLPNGGVQGTNEDGALGYLGPCPSHGKRRHRYFFRLYALRVKLDLDAGATRDQLLNAMQGNIIEEAELMGTYQKTGAQG